MSDKTQLLFLAFFLLLIGCGADSGISPTPTCLIPTLTPRPTTTLAPNPNAMATLTSTPETTSPTATLTPTTGIFCTPTPTPASNGGGGNGTPIPQTTPNPRSITATDGTGVDSLTIDAPDQTLVAVGAGARTTAVAWQEANALFLSQTIGATQQIAKRLAVKAGQITLAYDGQDRLHAVWEANGRFPTIPTSKSRWE